VAAKQTPMMQQYEKMRESNPGFLLFYRMGDFYELFGEHAKIASTILSITLTKRRSSKEGDEGIPMCGVPFHAAEGYIAKLLKHGHKVALCEQTESPEEAKKARGYKALVNREVVRLYTGGTLTEESMLNPEQNNYLAALHNVQGKLALAWLDLSTGEFNISTVEEHNLEGELTRLGAGEIIVTENIANKYMHALTPYVSSLSYVATNLFDKDRAVEKVKAFYGIGTLDAFSFETEAQKAACGALLTYIEQTQTGKMPTLERPHILRSNHFLHIDASSRINLELTHTLKGEHKGSLLHNLDNTITPSGSRMLASWIMAPLQNLEIILSRQEAINTFKTNPSQRSDVRELLKQTSDMSRALSRLMLERGSPRDLDALRKTLGKLPQLLEALNGENLQSKLLKKIGSALTGFNHLADLLDRALMDENLPMLTRDGDFVKAGFCEKFDGYKELATNGMDMLRELEREEAERTGISSLRIKYNKVWGYFIEVTKTHLTKVPEDYVHRQTTTSTQRFSTAKLMELEQSYSAAAANSLAREQQIFAELVGSVKENAEGLLQAAEALATMDVISAAAELAESRHYICPTMDESDAFDIRKGRHCVVESSVENYMPNSTDLSGGKLWLITGPNMAGKSTFLRQNAIITIMAHMGFFIPATKAHIGLVDRIFTRIGAADDLARGQSTFMMEMVETAAILNNATEKSLVILDEIGRGTATYDGLAIAWSAVEHLLTVNKSRGLFATHYHEMTQLADTYKNLSCHQMAVKEWNSEIVFLHEVKNGQADRSYGVHVGKLAGLPTSVTTRAESLLKELEKTGKENNLQATLPLFEEVVAAVPEVQTSKVEEELLKIDLDDLSPRQAQDMLYHLSTLAKES